MANFDPSIFPKDLTMSLESNHIINEVKEFVNREDFIFVPDGGPFYTDSLIIKNTQNGQLLKPIIDYQLLYLNEQATMESNKNVVAVIRVINTNVPSVTLNYRVIGGEYGNTVAGILQELRNAGPIDNNVDWEINVFKKPEVFPAAPHYHNANDFTDWSNVWVQLEGIRTAIIHSDLPSWASVYRYFDLRIQATTNLYQNMLNGLPQPGYTHNEADAKFVTWDELGSWMGANYYNISQINTQVNAINNSITSGDQNTLAAAKSYTDTKLATAVANANNYALTVANNSYSAALADSKAYTDSKFNQATNYSDQKLVEAKAYTDSKVGGQNPSVSADALLADPRFQQYKVGDVFATTNNYADGAAVRAALGYGTWTRYAQGRVIIGQTTAPVVDTAGNSRTFNLGEFGGEYKHKLTIAEMPSHSFNIDYTTGNIGGTGRPATASTSSVAANLKTESLGSDTPHNNIQPYVVGQYWLRVPDSFKDVTYDLYITSDAAGNNRVTVINEGQDIYLWVDIANSVKGVQLADITFAQAGEIIISPDVPASPTALVNGKNRLVSIVGDKYATKMQTICDWTVILTDTYTVMNVTKRAVLTINNNTADDIPGRYVIDVFKTGEGALDVDGSPYGDYYTGVVVKNLDNLQYGRWGNGMQGPGYYFTPTRDGTRFWPSWVTNRVSQVTTYVINADDIVDINGKSVTLPNLSISNKSGYEYAVWMRYGNLYMDLGIKLPIDPNKRLYRIVLDYPPPP